MQSNASSLKQRVGLPLAAAALIALGLAATFWTRAWSGGSASGPLVVSRALQAARTFHLGRFLVRWSGRRGQLTVRSQGKGGHLIFQTPPHTAFVGAAEGAMTGGEHIGYYRLQRTQSATYPVQVVSSITLSQGVLTLRGTLRSMAGRSVPYSLALRPEGRSALSYRILAGSPANRVYLRWRSTPGEAYYGFGEQFTYLDMAGKRFPIFVEEHGYGRGQEPLTMLADLTNGGAGGHFYNTYAPVPFFLTSTMQSLYSESAGYQAFDLTRPGVGQLEVDGRSAKGLIFAGRSPREILRDYTAVAGRMRPLPAWTQQGLILGDEGGTKVVLGHLRRLLAAGVPVTGLWIQDWSGLRRTSFGEQVVWNWRLSATEYPDFAAFRSYLQSRGIRLLGYVDPFLVDTGKPAGPANLYLVALRRGYLVKTAQGKPYALHYPGRTAYIVDLTNPAAVQWLEGVMRRELVGNGFSGWMADFGEELPLRAVLYSGASGAAAHNLYPVLWAKLNRDVMRQAGLGGSGLVFLRSGFSGSPGVMPSLWLGDQLESWDASNGLQSSVTALLSAGLSGFSMAHGDMGGYTSLTQFPLHYVRTPELLERWMEVDAFTPLMRSHVGNLPAKNAQVWSSRGTIKELQRMATLFQALAPYRERLMKQAAETGAPLDRPLFFNYPKDPEAYQVGSREFMLGRDVLVTAVDGPGVRSVRAYLPKGDWIEIWTGREYAVGSGDFAEVSAPIGRPAVFARVGTQAQRLLARAVLILSTGP